MTIPKDNYTKTPNVALGIMARLPAAGRIYATLIRFTYGWGKTTAEISIASFHRLTGLSINSVKKGLRDLMLIGAVKRTNPKSIKNAQWEILDQSKIDPSFFDPSFIDGYPNRQPSKIDASNNKNPSKIAPQSTRIKDKNKDIPVKESESTAPTSVEKVISFFEQEIGRASPSIKEEILKARSSYTEEWLIEAIRKAVRNNKPSWAYVKGTLVGWKDDGKMNIGVKNDVNKNTKYIVTQDSYTPADRETAERIKSNAARRKILW